MENLRQKKISFWQWVGASAIGLSILGYVFKGPLFAERHIQFSFLDFPLFVGEGLFLFCALILGIVWFKNPPSWKKEYFLIVAYVLFVAFKAISGYLEWGPLACRHTALFYYPLFAVFGAIFIDKSMFSFLFRIFSIVLIFIFFIFDSYYHYYSLGLFILGLVLILSIPRKSVRFSLLFLMVIFAPYYNFFNTTRMLLLACTFVVAYLIFALLSVSSMARFNKILFTIFYSAIFIVSMFYFNQGGMFESIFDFERLAASFKERNAIVQEKKDSYVWEPRMQLRLYHPNQVKVKNKNIDLQKAVTESAGRKKNLLIENMQEGLGRKEALLSGRLQPEKSRQVSINNATFRIFIWRDMFVEYFKYPSFFGFDFGKPLRSVSLEILGSGRGEWSRDGWVAAHNSYFHMIYRSGVVGVLFIWCVIFCWIKMVFQFIRKKSAKGILVCGILLSSLVTGHFLVVFEVPHTAIPFWVFYGVVWRYYLSFKEEGDSHELEE